MIALAFNAELPVLTMKHLKRQAVELEQRYQIEFQNFLRDLRKYNAQSFNRLIPKMMGEQVDLHYWTCRYVYQSV